MCMQKHKSFIKPWRKRLAERLSVALCLTMRTQDDARRGVPFFVMERIEGIDFPIPATRSGKKLFRSDHFPTVATLVIRQRIW